MRKLIFGLSCAVLALGATAPAQATAFFNDFESGGFVGTSYTILHDYEGWETTAGSGIEVQYGNVAGLAHSGTHLVELDSNNNSKMSRAIDAGDYTLTFWYSDRPNVAALSNGIDVLLDGLSIFPVDGGLGGTGTSWSFKTVSFTAGAGAILTFAALGTSDSYGGYIDDVTLTPVPEAATWAMMLLGFGVIGNAMRRRRSARVSFA